MPLPFNKNLDLKLLKLVKENPILYNTRHAKYLDFDSREVIWQKIGDSLSRPAVNFAGLQCQIQLGDFQENKHKPGFIEKLEEYLPAQYLNAWSVEKKIMKEYATHQGKSELEAKFLYIKTARALPTYGVTFFLVKEKQKDKKKLVPRLLGINAEAILRLDEVTKEILQQWPLTHVKTYHAGKSQTFTLNFGDYSDKEYSVKTQDCLRIRDILEGYIDIIRRRMLAKPYASSGESMTICQDNVQMGKSHLIEHVSHNPSKMVTESFVGPTKLVPFDQGSNAQSGTMITTVQQIVVTDHLKNQQQALKGEMPLRGDMSQECIRKLNRMNSNSVKVVELLTEPSDSHVKDAQQIVHTMQEDFPVVQKGVKETADKQTIDDAKKMLLDELQDLNNYMNKLASSIETGQVNPSDAKDAAESIADLTTQIYFSMDPKTKRRSEFLRRSRKSFKEGEKTEQSLRRASFIAAATTALHAVDTATLALREEYNGPKLDAEQQKKLERALEDRMGKLNAAIAQYLTAHSDPDNIDYAAAINSMNTINELMPKLARDAQILASTMDPAGRKELQDEMRDLFDGTKKVCGMTGNEDHEKMQEATNHYADVAGRLIFKFARGSNADKENEIVQLAKEAGEKVSQLLVAANELISQAESLPAATELDEAGARTVGAARDLLYCAQLTAPAIHEPHCQSALTGAASNVQASVQHVQAACRPLLQDPARQHLGPLLHGRANDVIKALERLKDAFGNLEGDNSTDASLPLQEKKRLKFITTLSGAKNKLQALELVDCDQAVSASAPTEQQKAEAQRRLEQKMAQLNAAVAALAAATADRENPDYETAELALATITELMPQIAKDTEIVSSDKDEATRAAMRRNLAALRDAARDMCEGDGYQHAQGEALSSFATASGKLVFLVSPGADKGKQKYIKELSSQAHAQASELVSGAQHVLPHVPAHAHAELARGAAQAQDDAQALLSVAQVTAASIGEERCRDALSSAVGKLHASADKLAAHCQHAAQAHCAGVQASHKQLSDSLSKLAHVCAGGDDECGSAPSAQQEKQRVQFVQSMSGVKRRLDAAAQQLTKPMACQLMREEDAAELEHQLRSRLAQLNAAVAALAAATQDRSEPDYARAERALSAVTALMPRIVQDGRKLCGTKNDAGQAAMLEHIRALCDACHELCDSAAGDQGLGDAAAKFSAASRDLGYQVNPDADSDKENELIGLAAASCVAAGELLSQAQQLTQTLSEAGDGGHSGAAHIDARGARAADAAQALLSVAQATAPTIASADCQDQLISAAEKLRSTASELTSSCTPHLQQRPEMKQQVLSSQQQLADSLDNLIEACKAAQGGGQSTISPAEKEKRRLKFINSLSGAKNRLYDSEQQLKQPLSRQSLQPAQAASLQQRLAQRVAQLSAAIAALAAAKADADNPDYAAAEKAVKEISELMPLIVQDARKLSSTQEAAGQAAMMDELAELCRTSRDICERSETDPKVNAADFNKAASKLVFLVSPAADTAKEKQVMELSDAACKQATHHLSQVQAVSEQLGPAAGARLGPAGARLQDAAHTLHAVAQATSPSISDPSCSAAVVSAAEKLRNSATELTDTCVPHVQREELKQLVLSSQRQLADSVDRLVDACQPGHAGNLGDAPSAEQQEKQRLQLISSASGARDCLDAAQRQLEQPVICQMMREEDGIAIQRKLADRLAQLNAAVAALAAATQDREKPDYAAADRAVRSITELMPQLVQESRTLCGTKTDAEQAGMLQQLRALCDASRQICDSAGQPEGLSDAAAKWSAASGKLLYIVSPTAQDAHEKQVLALSAATRDKAGELLSLAHRLTEVIPDARAAAELDTRRERAAIAARALHSVAQATAPTIANPDCQKQLISAAEKLRDTASSLTSSCAPHLQQHPEMKQQVLSSQRQLADSLDKLIEACKAAQGDNMDDSPSAQQEKHRLKFITSLSGTKGQLDAAEQLLKEPMLVQTTQLDPATLQRKLRGRLALLNATVAALAAATQDREHPDYAAAHRAVEAIPKLLREVIHDSRALASTKDAPGAAALTEDVRALCDVTRHLCDNVAQPQDLSDAATKFSAASGKMMLATGPKTHSAHDKQIIELSAASCAKASELLSPVQRLTELLNDAGAVSGAAEQDARGARAVDAAQALLNVAQLTASSISEPACSAQLISAAEKLRNTASSLTSSCTPHLQQHPEMKQQVLSSQRQLADSIDKLIDACKAAQNGPEVELSPQQEKQRLKFVSSVSGASKHLDSAEQQIKKPLVSEKLQPDAGAVLQQQLSRRLAQLNAAVAALASATQDGKNPDYPAAERAVIAITELMPQIVQESHKLCGTQDAAGQAAVLQQLRVLCDASRDICDSAGQPVKLNEASAKLANASRKLVFIVSPEGSQGAKPAVPSRKPPPPPARAATHADATRDFLNTLRSEESRDKVKIVAVDAKTSQASEDEKRAYKQFCEMIDNAEIGLKTAEDGLKTMLHNAKSGTVSNSSLSAPEVARTEAHAEAALARASVHVAALVAASYADKLDYKAAMEPTISLTDSVKTIVKDGSAICDSLPEHARTPFLEDMDKLCRATRSIGDAAKDKDNVKKLNDAAISFGDQSVKLLRVVSCKVDPALEKEVISRAKAIGDTASRLAQEAGGVCSDARSSSLTRAHVTRVCSAGAGCVDSAGKLVYTAKLIAPTIHHAICQDTLVSSADNLSSSLTEFSKTWAPLASSQHSTIHKLTQEAAHLEDLVEKLRKDVKAGKFGKKKEVEQMVNLDSPLRRMTMQIIDTAKSMAEYGSLSAEQKKEYVSYSGRLQEAVRALDLANARFQRAPHDSNKRDELEIATQDLQMTLLQTRPARAGQEQNNIVDFRDFLQDLVKEAGDLQSTAKKNEGPAGKRVTDDIKLLSNKISEDAARLLNPADNFDGVTVMNTADDVMDIDMFGQECDVLVKEINAAIQGIHDQKAKQALRAKALALTESCYLLRFATNSHIMATKSAAFDEALQSLEHFQTRVMPPLAQEAARHSQKEKKMYVSPLGRGGSAGRASTSLLLSRQRALRGQPGALGAAVTYYAAAAVADRHLPQMNIMQEEVEEVPMLAVEDRYLGHLESMVSMTNEITRACLSKEMQVIESEMLYSSDTQTQNFLKELNDLDYMIASRKIKNPLLNAEDIDKLLMCQKQPVEGTPKQLEDKLHQLSTKLSSMSGTVVLSVKKPESLARSLHAAADVAAQLASTARALEDTKRPVQCKKIEEAAHEMCLATYSLLKTSELVCQDPNHHDSRRKLAEACRHLNDSINKLVRSVRPPGRVQQECGEVQRSLQLQRSLLQAAPQPSSAAPYAHCLDTLAEQRDVLQKLHSEQAMSREEFLKSMTFVASAVGNSAECAAQAAYLLSASEKDGSIGKEGIPDVGRLYKAVGAVEDSCVSIIMTNDEEQVKEESDVLKTQVQDLLHGMDDSITKTKDGELKEMLKQCRNDINTSSKDLFTFVKRNADNKEGTISKVMDLMDDVNHASNLIEHPDLVPTAGDVSADTQKHVDEVVKSSLTLLSNTEELIKQVKAAPEEPETMKWVMFNKRKDVLDAFENLLNTVRTSGQRVKLIEGSTDDPEEEKKSYVQKQFEAASKWLLKPVFKAEVKTSGQQAVRNLIEVANKISEDLKGSEQDDMRTLVTETEQLLSECSKKYDQEQYSVLMERVRELKKGIERGVVTRVVLDLMDAETPLADLDLVADYEKDESKRKFLLEKKIAELLSQLSRVTKTARLIAHTDRDASAVATQLTARSEQAELLAPKLVKAAQQRVATPDDKAVVENYKSLLAKYAESLSKIRDLCDQSVDPMDFVQTAGETMERMREESTKHNDPMQCARTSAAITKLANRVIHVGMSSSTARSDPELQKALSEAQQQLSAATPAADTRASRMPDWKDTTAKILQATGEVESLLCGETIFKTQPAPNQPIYNEALNLHVAIRDWSSRDNEIVAVAKRMAVLMAKLSNFMNNDKQHEVLATSKSIVLESHEVARLAKKLAHECTDHRIKTNLLQTCERIPTISGQLKMLTTVKGFSLGRHGTQEDKEALDMLVGNAQSLMLSIQDVVKGAASASVKIMSQRGPRMKWVRKTVY